jgi:hypothetical protein
LGTLSADSTGGRGSAAAIFEEQLQCGRDCAERDFVPGNLALGEQAHLETLVARREVEVDQFGTKEDVHLLDVRNIEHREQRAESDSCACLFSCLALGALCGALADLHEAGRQGPLAVARFDRALAQENAVAPDWNRADDRARIHIMNRPAVVTAIALSIVARWDPAQHRRTTR